LQARPGTLAFTSPFLVLPMACPLFTTLINGANIEVYIDFSKKNFIFPSKHGLLSLFFGQKSTVVCRLTGLCADNDQGQILLDFLTTRLLVPCLRNGEHFPIEELLLFVGCRIHFVHWTYHFYILILIF
jgi:hypothetical protein